MTNGLTDAYVRACVEAALREDGANNDATVAFLDLKRRVVTGQIVAKEEGVVAGIDVARASFAHCDPEIEFSPVSADGESVRAGDVIARVSGRADAMLSAERVALNFLQRLSGIATLTARYVAQVKGTGVRILDTRKTTPSYRVLERYAVRAGGGHNHRFNLTEMILIKENHIRSLGGVEPLIEKLSGPRADRTVEVEVDSIEFLRKLLGSSVDRIMLDNFPPDNVRLAVAEIRDFPDDDFLPVVEVSGGITLANITDYAIEGVDDISVGALTHSAKALDISMEVDSLGS
jgi:nicotinate-nucleotide pyrophosphorylase (carboxylating)